MSDNALRLYHGRILKHLHLSENYSKEFPQCQHGYFKAAKQSGKTLIGEVPPVLNGMFVRKSEALETALVKG